MQCLAYPDRSSQYTIQSKPLLVELPYRSASIWQVLELLMEIEIRDHQFILRELKEVVFHLRADDDIEFGRLSSSNRIIHLLWYRRSLPSQL